MDIVVFGVILIVLTVIWAINRWPGTGSEPFHEFEYAPPRYVQAPECEARLYVNEMHCKTCALTWDYGEDNPPPCLKALRS